MVKSCFNVFWKFCTLFSTQKIRNIKRTICYLWCFNMATWNHYLLPPPRLWSKSKVMSQLRHCNANLSVYQELASQEKKISYRIELFSEVCTGRLWSQTTKNRPHCSAKFQGDKFRSNFDACKIVFLNEETLNNSFQ